jgi:hypothetical protein
MRCLLCHGEMEQLMQQLNDIRVNAINKSDSRYLHVFKF